MSKLEEVQFHVEAELRSREHGKRKNMNSKQISEYILSFRNFLQATRISAEKVSIVLQTFSHCQ